MHKTSSNNLRLWGITKFKGIQKYTPYKIILGIISHRGPKANSRSSKKNTNKRIDRKTIIQTVFIHPIYEHIRQSQQKGYIQHIRQTRR